MVAIHTAPKPYVHLRRVDLGWQYVCMHAHSGTMHTHEAHSRPASTSPLMPFPTSRPLPMLQAVSRVTFSWVLHRTSSYKAQTPCLHLQEVFPGHSAKSALTTTPD